MVESMRASFVAECFWPGVTDADVRALDERVLQTIAGAGPGTVGYLGSILMRKDEVVLCLFDGDGDAVRRAAEQAGVPFARIVEAARSTWAVGRR